MPTVIADEPSCRVCGPVMPPVEKLITWWSSAEAALCAAPALLSCVVALNRSPTCSARRLTVGLSWMLPA